MLFAIYYEMTPERRDEVLERFQKFGDAAPKGMKVVGNWLSVTLLEGWSIVEANDIADLGKLFHPGRTSTSITSRRSSTKTPRTAFSQPTEEQTRCGDWKAATPGVAAASQYASSP